MTNGGAANSLLTTLFRPEADQMQSFHLMIIAHVIVAGAFVWIYRRGAENKPWLMQGLRIGLAVALLALIPTCMIYCVIQPLPVSLVVQQSPFGGALVLVPGALTAFLIRDGNSQ